MLSVCGTPIGNLSDASPRLVETLSRADVVCCEDTRVTAKLLAHFGIRTSTLRCDENVIEARIPELLARLEAGERVAFVSDAGMPCISDPGQQLVDAALDAGLDVEVVPGPSAVSSALARSGLSAAHFFFEGFLPRKAGAQKARLAELVSSATSPQDANFSPNASVPKGVAAAADVSEIELSSKAEVETIPTPPSFESSNDDFTIPEDDELEIILPEE